MAIKLKLNPVGRYAEVIVNNGKPKIFNPTSITAYNVAVDGLTISVFPGKLLWAEVQIDGVAPTTWEDFKDKFGTAFPNPNSGSGGPAELTEDNEGYGIVIDEDEQTIGLIESGTNSVATDFGDWIFGTGNADGWTNLGSSARFEGGVTGGLSIEGIGVVEQGTGYLVNDILDVPGGGGGQLRVTTIGGGGEVTGFSIETKGAGYSLEPDDIIFTTGGTGTGFCATFSGFTNLKLKYGGVLEEGAKYHVRFTVERESGDALGWQVGDAGGSFDDDSGNVSEYVTYRTFGVDTGIMFFNPDPDFVGTVSAVSVRKVFDVEAPALKNLQSVLEIGRDADGNEILDLGTAIGLQSAVRFDQVARSLYNSDFSAFVVGDGWSINGLNQLEYDGTGIIGKIIGFNLQNAGNGYAPGDTFTADGGDGGAWFVVDSVSGGSVTGISMTLPGSGYTWGSQIPTVVQTGGGDNGVTIAITQVSHISAYNQSEFLLADFARVRLRTTIKGGSGRCVARIQGTDIMTMIGAGTTVEWSGISTTSKEGRDLDIVENPTFTLVRYTPAPGFEDQPFVLKRFILDQIPDQEAPSAYNTNSKNTFDRVLRLSQSSTSPPVNLLNGQVTINNDYYDFVYEGVGAYSIKSKGWLQGNATVLPLIGFVDAGAGDTYMVRITVGNINTLFIETLDTDHVTPKDDVLNAYGFRVITYND